VQVNRRVLLAGAASAGSLALLIGGAVSLANCQGQAPRSAARHATRELTSPFTGEPVPYLRRELIFKIDNVPQARPPTALTHADLVYLLPVDGGLSRIFAVFSSHIPPVVGPVRSARQEDIELLRQFGRPAFAFSGAQPALLPVVEHARIVNLYAGTHPGYFRNANRIAPYNLYARTRQLLAQAPHASLARDIGFRFGPPPPGGQRTTSYFVKYPAASFTFTWSAAQQRWLVRMDGTRSNDATGGRLGARTVVVQYVKVGRSVFRELGIKPPDVNSVGSGTAVVLRDGRAYRVHWSRPFRDGGTTFTLPNGQRMPFSRGQVWVVFGYGPGSIR
jgi:hypothetical protein